MIFALVLNEGGPIVRTYPKIFCITRLLWEFEMTGKMKLKFGMERTQQ